MAIKDKDGKVYKLRGPNPLMKDQRVWDKKQTKFFNLDGWQTEVVEDATQEVPNVVDIAEEWSLKKNEEANATTVNAQQFLKEVEEAVAVEEPPVVEPQPEPEPVVDDTPRVEPTQAPPPKPTITVDGRLARMLEERGVEFFCAPAIGKRLHVDELYESSYETTQFGDKFVFDAIVIDQSDLQLQFWCVRPITIGSVIHRKAKERGERWWRVADVEPKTGGYLVIANTSELNPDFS
jgi:hypothetical protein